MESYFIIRLPKTTADRGQPATMSIKNLEVVGPGLRTKASPLALASISPNPAALWDPGIDFWPRRLHPCT